MWGIDSGLSLYGDCNYTSPFGIQSGMRLDNNNKWTYYPIMVDARFTLSGGAHGVENRSNVAQLTMYRMFTNREGGSNASQTWYMYGLKDEMSFDWPVSNFYGIYLLNHSTYASNSWGIWNNDRTYLGGNVNLNGELSGNGRINLARTVTDYNQSQSEGSANSISLNYAPSTSNYSDDYSALAVSTSMNTTNAFIGNTIGLDAHLSAVDGSNGISEFKTVRVNPDIGASYSGTVDQMIGVKSIASINPASTATVNNLWLFWAATSFGSYDNIKSSVGLKVDDLDPSGVMGSNPTYGVKVDNQSAANSWGIYVGNSSNYFSGAIIRGDGTIQPVSLSDDVTANDSIYYSTNSSKLTYKDSSGAVHPLY